MSPLTFPDSRLIYLDLDSESDTLSGMVTGQDWERGMYENLSSLFDQKTCPDPDRVFQSLSTNEAWLVREVKSDRYSDVYAPPFLRSLAEKPGWLRLIIE